MVVTIQDLQYQQSRKRTFKIKPAFSCGCIVRHYQCVSPHIMNTFKFFSFSVSVQLSIFLNVLCRTCSSRLWSQGFTFHSDFAFVSTITIPFTGVAIRIVLFLYCLQGSVTIVNSFFPSSDCFSLICTILHFIWRGGCFC